MKQEEENGEAGDGGVGVWEERGRANQSRQFSEDQPQKRGNEKRQREPVPAATTLSHALACAKDRAPGTRTSGPASNM
jgi:hypothetical protein